MSSATDRLGGTGEYSSRAESVIERLMDISQYNPAQHSLPYRYVVQGAGRILEVFGARHFSDPASPCYVELCDALEAARPQVLFTETVRELLPQYAGEEREHFLKQLGMSTREDAVKMSESYLGVKIALDLKIEVRGLEPSLGMQLENLVAQGFDKRDVVTFFILSTLSVSHLYTDRMSPSELGEYRLTMLRKESDWGSKLLSMDSVGARSEELFGRFPISDHAWFRRKVDPTTPIDDSEHTIINKICGVDTRFRDVHFIRQIAAGLDEFKRVFVLYGGSHAAMEEQALRGLFVTC